MRLLLDGSFRNSNNLGNRQKILILSLTVTVYLICTYLCDYFKISFAPQGAMHNNPPRCGGLLCNVLSGRSIF
jgi:glycopeptide antibiotics resistance protein